jgi:hypothetical protein
MSDAPAAETNKRFRSPPYPAISLSKAIDRAKELYAKALHHPVKVTVLADAWDYGAKSSGLWATAAALLHFGLLTDNGSGNQRKFTLTDAAIRIVRDPDPNSQKRCAAIKAAAITPKIFRELWGSYGSSHASPSDMVLKAHLTLDRRDAGLASYSDAAADEVIRSYRETIAFAKLDDSDTLPDGSAGMDLASEDPVVLPDPANAPDSGSGKGKLILPLRDLREKGLLMAGERELTTGLLSKDASFRLIVSGSVGVKEIERLIQKLQLDKEILADTGDDANADRP